MIVSSAGSGVAVDAEVLKLVSGAKRQCQFSSRILQHGFSHGTSMQSDKQRKERGVKATAQGKESLQKLNALFDKEIEVAIKIKKKIADRQMALANLIVLEYSSIPIQAAIRGFLTRIWYKRVMAGSKIYLFICRCMLERRINKMMKRLGRFFKMAKLRLYVRRLFMQSMSKKRAAARLRRFEASKAASAMKQATEEAAKTLTSVLLFGTQRAVKKVTDKERDISMMEVFVGVEKRHISIIRRLFERFYRNRRIQLLHSQYGKVALYILSGRFYDVELDGVGDGDAHKSLSIPSSLNNDCGASFLTQLPCEAEVNLSPTYNVTSFVDRNSFLSYVNHCIRFPFTAPPSIQIKAYENKNAWKNSISSNIPSDCSSIVEMLALPTWARLTTIFEVVQFMWDIKSAVKANPDLLNGDVPTWESILSYSSFVSHSGLVKKQFLPSLGNYYSPRLHKISHRQSSTTNSNSSISIASYVTEVPSLELLKAAMKDKSSTSTNMNRRKTDNKQAKQTTSVSNTRAASSSAASFAPKAPVSSAPGSRISSGVRSKGRQLINNTRVDLNSANYSSSLLAKEGNSNVNGNSQCVMDMYSANSHYKTGLFNGLSEIVDKENDTNMRAYLGKKVTFHDKI
jgi:hypothetical protein